MTIYNVEEYINLTVDMTVGQGVEAQVEAFKSGFNCVFDIQNLSGFRSVELVNLFGSGDEDWSYESKSDEIIGTARLSRRSSTYYYCCLFVIFVSFSFGRHYKG